MIIISAGHPRLRSSVQEANFGAIDTNVTFLEQTLVMGNDNFWIYGLSNKIETTRRSDGMSSTTKGNGKVDISHYCIKPGSGTYSGCGYANGCVSTKCNNEKTGAA